MSNRQVSSLLVFVALALLGACKGEEDLRVFNEVGTWSLQSFDLAGMMEFEVDQDARKDAFLLQFDETEGSGVVAAATCHGGGSGGVTSSTCRIDESRTWECRCFSYIHEKPNVMEWQEFAAGDAVPEVVSETGEDGTGGETEGDPSDTINVAKDTTINGAVLFQPLPYVTNVFQDGGLFDSNGIDSKYLFQQKADQIFDESGCAATCGT